MKKFYKILSIFMVFSICLSQVSFATYISAEDIEIIAPSAILVEKDTGEVIYEKNSLTAYAPASVTKVMTILLILEAIEAGSIALDDMVTASATASSMGGSQIWLETGETLSVSDMLKCITVVSANDCAVAMAEYLAGSEAAFVTLMNKRAEELGLQNTNFTNCTGLFDDPLHYTCAYDLAIISCEVLKHELIKDYSTIWMDTIRDGEFTLTNTNKLVNTYEGCTGLKTGYTSLAMYCLCASAMRDGTEFIAIIMHSDSSDSRNSDAKTLLDYGFSNYSVYSLRATEALPPILIEFGEMEAITPDYNSEDYMLISKSLSEDISYSLDLPETIKAPIEKGQVIGYMKIVSGTNIIKNVEIVSAYDVDRLSCFDIFKELLLLLLSA